VPDSRTRATHRSVDTIADTFTGTSGDEVPMMSLYQLHRCVRDQLRSASAPVDRRPRFDVDGYDLRDDERRAVETGDVAGLYQLGLHPLLLHEYCRANGYPRSVYRTLLQAFARPQIRKARWQR
jgi:hypothetical protein